MGRVKTFTNGGSLLPGDLNSMEDDYEFAFSTYKTIQTGSGITGTLGAGATVYALAGNGMGPVLLANGGGNGTNTDGSMPFYFDPADHTANTRTTQGRLRATVAADNAPGMTFTFGLYNAGTMAGGKLTAGTLVAGTTSTVASPASGAMVVASGAAPFTLPAVGFYLLGFTVSAAMAAGSNCQITMRLQVRQT